MGALLQVIFATDSCPLSPARRNLIQVLAGRRVTRRCPLITLDPQGRLVLIGCSYKSFPCLFYPFYRPSKLLGSSVSTIRSQSDSPRCVLDLRSLSRGFSDLLWHLEHNPTPTKEVDIFRLSLQSPNHAIHPRDPKARWVRSHDARFSAVPRHKTVKSRTMT